MTPENCQEMMKYETTEEIMKRRWRGKERGQRRQQDEDKDRDVSLGHLHLQDLLPQLDDCKHWRAMLRYAKSQQKSISSLDYGYANS